MKVIIVSDIHDNLICLKSCLKTCQEEGFELLLCLGDVTNIDTLKFLADNFIGTIHIVRGNADSFDDSAVARFENIKFYGKIGYVEIGPYKIGLCHEPFLIPRVIDDKCDLVFYGHTHKPWIEKRDGAQIVNPGTLGGVFGAASFAVWDTEKGELKLRLVESDI